jgi:hypothetical protein
LKALAHLRPGKKTLQDHAKPRIAALIRGATVGNAVLLSILVATVGVSVVSRAGAASICQGPRPKPGTMVHGPVLQIDDGSTICIATGASPSTWRAIHLSQVDTSRATLMAAAFGKNATCAVGSGGTGDCTIEGHSLAQELRRPDMALASARWR